MAQNLTQSDANTYPTVPADLHCISHCELSQGILSSFHNFISQSGQ